MNTEDPTLDGWVGRGVMDETGSGPSGTMDLVSAGVLGRLANKVVGGRLRKARPTLELIKEGKAAQPQRTQEEQDVLASIVPDDNANQTPTGSDIPEQPQAPTEPSNVEAPDEPAGIVRRDAAAAVDNTGTAPGEAENDSIDPVEFGKRFEENKAKELENRTWERNVNLDYVENAEQLGPVLETIAQEIPEAPHKSFEEIRADVDAKGHMNVLKDVLTDTSNPRALTDVQLLAGREVLLGLTQQVEELAEKIAINKSTAEDLLLFDKLTDQAVMMQRFMQGSIREAGRALNSMKIVAQAVNSGSAEQIALSAKGGNHQMRAQQIVEMKAAGVSAAKIVDESYKMGKVKGLTAALVNLRNASILTGFKTQAVNLVSNTFYGTLSTLVVKPTAAGVGVVRQAFGRGQGERVFLAEVGGELAGFRHGYRDALLMGVHTWYDGTFKNQGEYISSFGGRKIDEVEGDSPLLGDAIADIVPGARMTGVPQVANAWQRTNESIAYGLLTASDEFFKAIAYRKSLYASAVRQAYMEDIPESQVPARVDELLNNVTKDMHDGAVHASEKQTFTNRSDVGPILTIFADSLVKAGAIFPPLKLIVPFVRTPTALFDRTLKFSPLAVIQKEFWDRVKAGGVDGDMAIAEMGTGIAMMGMMISLYADGDITGEGPGYGPGKSGLTKVLDKAGWQSNSVRLPNGTYMKLDRGFDPVAAPILAVASYLDEMYYAKHEPEAVEIAIGASFALAKHFKDNTYMSGVSDLMAVIEGRKNWKQFTAGQTAGFVPSLMRDTADIARGVTGKETTPRVPASQQFWDMLRQQIRNRVPGMQPEAIQRYWDGTPAVAGGGEMMHLYNSVSPVRLRNEQGKTGRPVDLANNELYENGVAPTPPSPNVSIEYGSKGQKSGLKVNLLNDLQHGAELYDKLLEFVGGARREAMDQLVDSSQYENLPGEKGPGSWHSIALEKGLGFGLDLGKRRFLEWMSEQDLSADRYGESIEMLNPDVLRSMLGDLEKGYSSEEDLQALGRMGVKGVQTSPPRKAPQYVPNI